jgi:exopolysaccharide biosynthesis polyprenyl glycosylphosphotransferase
MIVFVRITVADNPEVAEEAIRAWLFAAVYVIAGRAVLTMVVEGTYVSRGTGAPTLILGAGQVGHLVARRLLAHPEMGLRPVGFLDANPLELERPSGLPVLGSPDDLERIVREHGVEHAIVSFYSASHETQLAVSRTLQQMEISVSIVPRLFEGVPDNIELERAGGIPLVTIYPSDPHDWRVAVKYASDRVVAALLILLLSPVLLVAAAATLISLGRPIFFRQRRVGLDSREFDMLKYRTMAGTPDQRGQSNVEWAEAQASGEIASDHAGAGETAGTKGFAALLRSTGIDELPQLFNVVRGEMSVVGPRPEQPAYVAMFEQSIRRYDDRHRVKAGITGWAQVHGLRGDTRLDDRVEWDNYYIENWSPWLDLKIILLTFVTLFRGLSK